MRHRCRAFRYCSVLLLLPLCIVLGACSVDDPVEAFYRGDDARAYTIWAERAEEGDAEAANYLGILHQMGRGVDRDPEAAFRWYRRAALAGHAAAQRNLGNLYEAGLGVEQNNQLAYGWYHFAAEQGNAAAQRYIVAMTGELTPNQIMQAREFVRKELQAHAGRGAP